MCSQLAQQYSGFLTSVETTDGETVLVVGGDLDMAVAPLLGAVLQDACSGSQPVVVDAYGITFVDAAGLRGLLGGYRSEVVANVRIRNASPPLVRLLATIGMLELLEDRPL